MNLVVFCLLTSVTTAHQYASVTQNYKDSNHISLSKGILNSSEQSFLFDLYYSDIAFTMVIPDPHLALDYFKKTFNSIASMRLSKNSESNTGFRPGHSTVTAASKVWKDVC